jgi:hypothetical protein
VWVEKLLAGVLELGGFHDVVTWPGFVYVLLKFCTLSKLELSQVLFFVIANEMKSWTVHYLTTSQLEEFYEDYESCEVRSFSTGSINFSTLSLAKYNMVEFIQLTYRFSQLINPILHLQRCLRQSLPSMRFWRDYDRQNPSNNFVTLDFFRYQKSSSLMDLLSAAGNKDKASIAPEQEEMIQRTKATSLQNPHVFELDEKLGENIWNLKSQIKRKPLIDTDMPIPLPGPGPPGWLAPKRGAVRAVSMPPPLPAWIEERCKTNVEPLRGVALGTAAIPKPPPNWQTPLAHAMTPEQAKSIIQMSQRPVQPEMHHGYEKPKGKHQVVEDKAGARRSKELDFVTKNRKRVMKLRPITHVVEGATVCELMMRPAQRKVFLQKMEDTRLLLGQGVNPAML